MSTAWALADEDTKAVIADCHRQAIDYVLSYAESHVFHSRSGAGGIVEEDVTGVIATSFTHFTSRAGRSSVARPSRGLESGEIRLGRQVEDP